MRTRLLTPLVLVALLAAAAGVTGAVVAAPTPTPAGLSPADQPRTAAVQRQSFDDERSVEVSFRVEGERTLAVRTGGTVTWSGCVPGTTVTSGQTLLRVDERPVVALHTDVPLYRDLAPGDRGTDVAALQRELAALGHAVDADGRYGGATSRAVSRLLTDAGVTRPDGALRLAGLVWMPERTLTPSTCSTTPGAALGDGEAVAAVAGALVAVTFPVPGGLREGARDLTLFGVTTTLDPVGGEVTDAEFLAAVGATPDYAVAQQTKDGQKPKAALVLHDPVEALKVPPTALFAIEGTAGCVEQDDVAVPVTIIGSGLGASLVLPVEEGTEVTRVTLGAAVTHDTCAPGTT